MAERSAPKPFSRFLPASVRAQLERLHTRDVGHGYDEFGLRAEWLREAAGFLDPLYRHYFRVTAHDSEHIPTTGPAVLASNHSGGLPLDGAMIVLDVLHRTDPPRVLRAIADGFVPGLPFVSLLFSRVGVVVGTRANLRRLLQEGELVLVFPEGTRGIGKLFSQRYQLQTWNVGHAELALRHRAPVVPVAVVGAEEQWPQIARFERFRLFGAPYLPVFATPLPMPVHYHIYYGQPIALHEEFPSERAYDPGVQREAAARVRDAVAALIARGLAERPGVFL